MIGVRPIAPSKKRRMNDMTSWMLRCKNCGTNNESSKGTVSIKCGIVTCYCVCSNCSREVDGQQEYWQWLGLTEGPPAELESDLPAK